MAAIYSAEDYRREIVLIEQYGSALYEFMATCYECGQADGLLVSCAPLCDMPVGEFIVEVEGQQCVFQYEPGEVRLGGVLSPESFLRGRLCRGLDAFCRQMKIPLLISTVDERDSFLVHDGALFEWHGDVTYC